MKWGVRRTPEQLGHHKILKGTKMYRVAIASKADSLGSGATYVTYLDPDRDLYRGWYANNLRKNQGGKPDEKMVENTYSLKEDLNIPSRETLRAAYSKVTSNEKLKKEAIESLITSYLKNDEFDYRFNYGDDWQKQLEEDAKQMVKQTLNDWGTYSPEQTFSFVARSLGPSSPAVKNAVIKELKAKGYNAMVDEASVGGRGVSPREGVDPIIIFDGEKALEKEYHTSLNNKSMYKAQRRYDKWSRKANSHRDQPW